MTRNSKSIGNMSKEKKEEQPHSDSAICGTLCICQALAVLSAVSIIYLSVIVYLPAKRELDSGIGESPVMCTTVERRKRETSDESCTVSSCTEWCLSKGGGSCDQIYVRVRENGTNVQFQGCHETFYKTCPVLDDTSTETEFNCKKDNQCTELEGMFLCEIGVCRNISEVFSCRWTPEDEELPPQNCYHKRNCVELDGMYSCTSGYCTRLNNWKCTRKCEDIPIRGRNVLLIAGDRIVAAHCYKAINTRTNEEIWKASRSDIETPLLTVSCTLLENSSNADMGDNGREMTITGNEPPNEIVINLDFVTAEDCVNGTLLPRESFGLTTNLSTLMKIFWSQGYQHKLDSNNDELKPSRGTHFPFEKDITIYNKTLLFINHEGCVNTLQDECKYFYTSHGMDERNHSSPSRFPCYYAPHNQEFVVGRYDLIKTKHTFLFFFTVPAGIFATSCTMLFICSKIVGITRQGTMSLYCCKNKLEDSIDMKRLNNEEDEDVDDMD